ESPLSPLIEVSFNSLDLTQGKKLC
ncbi:hypothetical protein THAOC_25056, partial [Thalassiosira oceanica]